MAGPEKEVAPLTGATPETTAGNSSADSIHPRTPSLQGLSDRQIHQLILRESETLEADALARAATFDAMGLQVNGDLERDEAAGYANDAASARGELAWLDYWEAAAEWWTKNLAWNVEIFARLERRTAEREARR